jgi:hypothetical protein
MNKLFFSHSLTSYNTIGELKSLGWIREKYPDYEVVNPRELKLPDDFNKAMAIVLPMVKICNILVYYKDGSYSPGVDIEIQTAIETGITVDKIPWSKQ